MTRKHNFSKGDIVKLTTESSRLHGKCPEGRKDNRTARIMSIFGPDNDQVVMETDLRGCRYWNIGDLEKVEKIKDAIK